MRIERSNQRADVVQLQQRAIPSGISSLIAS